MKKEKEVAESLRHIVNPDRKNRYPIMTGVVKGVDTDAMECRVELTADSAGKATDGVTLNVSLENVKGVYGIPKVGADCLILEVDSPGKWELLKASEYTKVVVMADTLIEFNDGAAGGLVKVVDLVTKLNNLESDLNNLKTVFSTTWIVSPSDGGAALKLAAATWAGATLTPTLRANIENTKVTHG